MNSIAQLTEDVLHLFYPHLCAGCGNDVLAKNQIICSICYHHLPRTNYAKIHNNPVEKLFVGRLPIHAAHSEFYFSKGMLVQQLIHQIKYHGHLELGHYLGKLMGSSLLLSNRFQHIDAIIPLPMFAEKEKKRGYNQAAIIANGISESFGVPVLNNIVNRSKSTSSQTNKHRIERWQNVEDSFQIHQLDCLENKHFLLVDDVLTTGATLEACGISILQNPQVTLSIATLAMAGT